jgi:hypothetical protein
VPDLHDVVGRLGASFESLRKAAAAGAGKRRGDAAPDAPAPAPPA